LFATILLQIADQKKHVNTFDQTSYFNNLNDVVAATCNKSKSPPNFCAKQLWRRAGPQSGSSREGSRSDMAIP
jgi:hypothetical protein